MEMVKSCSIGLLPGWKLVGHAGRVPWKTIIILIIIVTIVIVIIIIVKTFVKTSGGKLLGHTRRVGWETTSSRGQDRHAQENYQVCDKEDIDGDAVVIVIKWWWYKGAKTAMPRKTIRFQTPKLCKTPNDWWYISLQEPVVLQLHICYQSLDRDCILRR